MLKITLTGNLGADPEKRFTQQGAALLEFRVAVNTRRKVKGEDEWEDRTDWFRIHVSGNRVDYLEERLAKGMRVVVAGRLQIDEYTSRDGEQRTALDVWADDVEFLSPRQDGDDDQAARPARQAAAAAPPPQQRKNARDTAPEDDDDLPF